MTQMPSSFDSTLLTIVLAVLAIGLPILIVLSIRFFWDRSLYLGRSKELEKLIWQLHRIASAMEHQLNVSFPSVQPGTEEATDIAFLERPAAQAKRAPTGAAAPIVQSVPAPAPQHAAAVSAKPAPAAAPPPPLPTEPPLPQPVAAQQQPAPAQQAAPAAAEQPAEPSGFPPLVQRDPKDPPRHGGVNSMFGF